MMSRQSAARKGKRGDTHTDGPAIPATLLGELRSSFRALQAAQAEVDAHNAAGRLVAQRALSAQAVHEHYVGRLKKRLPELKDGDTIDLERGIVRVAVQPSQVAQ